MSRNVATDLLIEGLRRSALVNIKELRDGLNNTFTYDCGQSSVQR